MESKPKQPKFRRRAEARPDEVLDAALSLFSEQGYAKTTVEQIAHRAGFSKGTVYLYFSSKQAVLEGLIERSIAPLTGSVFDAMSDHQGDPRVALSRFLRGVGAAMAHENIRAIPLIILREASVHPNLAQMFRDKVLDRALPAISALLQQGIADGHIRPVHPELTARTVMGPVIAHVILSEIFDLRPNDGLQMDKLVENHLDILFAGLAPAEGPLEGKPQ